jgi:hypothetical protein
MSISEISKNRVTLSHIKNKYNIRLNDNLEYTKCENILKIHQIEEILSYLFQEDKENSFYMVNSKEIKNYEPSSILEVLLDFPERLQPHEAQTNFDAKMDLEEKKKNNYNIRVIIGENECEHGNENMIAQRIYSYLNIDQQFISTRGGEENLLFQDVITEGLAKDRGLFVPKHIPFFSDDQFKRLINLNFKERCLRILESFPMGHLDPINLAEMINVAYSNFSNDLIIPLVKLSEKEFLMEEFYGPSATFKDLALQLFPHLFRHSLKNFDGKIAVLVATSGDTGSAVISGFEKIGVPVITLFPKGKISPIQEAQMCRAEGNVWVYGVKGDFDFCQTSVKDIFNDEEFNKHLKREFKLSLTSANSINWGRLLPQIFYSINSYLELVKVRIYLLI